LQHVLQFEHHKARQDRLTRLFLEPIPFRGQGAQILIQSQTDGAQRRPGDAGCSLIADLAYRPQATKFKASLKPESVPVLSLRLRCQVTQGIESDETPALGEHAASLELALQETGGFNIVTPDAILAPPIGSPPTVDVESRGFEVKARDVITVTVPPAGVGIRGERRSSPGSDFVRQSRRNQELDFVGKASAIVIEG
jgi:hypothetical protein